MMIKLIISIPLFVFAIAFIDKADAAIPSNEEILSTNRGLEILESKKKPLGASLIFDIPVTYNTEVSRWIRYFQGPGRSTFKGWLQRSTKYFPLIQRELDAAGLPKDLAYMVMIESGFSAKAQSLAEAVGPWQFIKSTGNRYGLRTLWWLDERMDLKKATRAAIGYMRDLYGEFNSWYLVAASYNMGENGLRRLIQRHKTADFWDLVEANALPQETRDYVPKLLAAMLIAKAPSIYGFRDLDLWQPLNSNYVRVPGGTQLDQIADYIGITRKSLRDLNPELKFGMIPKDIPFHQIKIPNGAYPHVRKFLAMNDKSVAFQ